MKDYKFDVGVLGAVIFGISGASDAMAHTHGIETGVEPLITPSHLMLFSWFISDVRLCFYYKAIKRKS